MEIRNPLRAQLDQALADGRVDLSEAKALETAIAKDGISSWDSSEFLDRYFDHVKEFAPDARSEFDRYVDAELPSKVTADLSPITGPWSGADNPELKAQFVEYAKQQGQLYVEGIEEDDPIQGQGGDCYLISALSALAKEKPQAIRDAIRDNGDGTYTVRFFERSDPAQPPHAVEITVNSDLPFDDAQSKTRPYYGTSHDAGELWPQLIEKAWAKWKGGYEQVMHGGMGSDVLDALTGVAAKHTYLSAATDPSKLFESLRDELSKGAAIVAGSHGYNSDDSPVDDIDVVFGHAYTLTKVYEKDGQQFVELRNPWNQKTHSGPQGYINLPIDRFIALFQELNWEA